MVQGLLVLINTFGSLLVKLPESEEKMSVPRYAGELLDQGQNESVVDKQEGVHIASCEIVSHGGSRLIKMILVFCFVDKRFRTRADEPFSSYTVDGNKSVSRAPVYISDVFAYCRLTR